MFSCIRLRKQQQCCKPKIDGETLGTNTLSFESSEDQISTGQCVKEVLCDIAPMNSCHLFREGHGLILKQSILMNVPFIGGMRDMK